MRPLRGLQVTRVVQAGFRKGRATRDQIANIHSIIEKARELQENFCFIDYAKAFDCVDHQLWKILQEMGIPDHLTCLLRNLYAGQEAAVRIGPNAENKDHGIRSHHFMGNRWRNSGNSVRLYFWVPATPWSTWSSSSPAVPTRQSPGS